MLRQQARQRVGGDASACRVGAMITGGKAFGLAADVPVAGTIGIGVPALHGRVVLAAAQA